MPLGCKEGSHYPRFMQRYPKGLPPYIVGPPVIASTGSVPGTVAKFAATNPKGVGSPTKAKRVGGNRDMKRIRMIGLCLVAACAVSATPAFASRCPNPGCGRAAALPAGAYAEFPLPTGDRGLYITAGPDRNLWFTESDKVGRITTGGTVTEFPLPAVSLDPILASPCGARLCLGEITAGPDGNLWFTGNWFTDQGLASEIGRITPGGTITEFPLALAGEHFVYPVSIAAGPDGNLWFQGGRITPSGTITKLPTKSLGGFASGPDGNLWFTEESNKIGRITLSGTVTRFSIPKCCATGITAGPDGNLWFSYAPRPGSVFPENSIGRISPTGGVSLFPLPVDRTPGGIAAGPDGNLWFTDQGNYPSSSSITAPDSIGRITPSGVINEFTISTSRPVGMPGITAGPDAKLWFIEGSETTTHEASSKIARIDPQLVPPPSPEKCVVPRLTGKKLIQAPRLLTRANCRSGRITRHGKVLGYDGIAGSGLRRILSQSPPPHRTLGFAAKVSVRLG